MLVLSAIVTLMSVDAAHRVHHQPGLYFGLVLILESGLFGSFTALNFFHWFLFWELSLIPAFFLIKLWGGHAPRPGSHAVLRLHHGRLGRAAALVPRHLSFHRQHGLRHSSPQLASTGALEQMVTAHLGPVMHRGSPSAFSPASPSKCP